MKGGSTDRAPASTRARRRRACWITAFLVVGVGAVSVAAMAADAATRTDASTPTQVEARSVTAPAPVASTTTTTTTTAPPPVPSTTTTTVAVALMRSATPAPSAAATSPSGDCGAALAYLAAHQAPGFVDTCGRGSALGHDGMTCWNHPPQCPAGARIIHIACPLPYVYMNEAHNSWTLTGQRTGIDPYGQGTAAEQQYCRSFR
jgi:hypothetical protein